MCLGFESNKPCAFLIECWECASPLDDEGDDSDDDDDQCLQNDDGRLCSSCRRAGPECRRGACKGFWFRKRWNRVDKG